MSRSSMSALLAARGIIGSHVWLATSQTAVGASSLIRTRSTSQAFLGPAAQQTESRCDSVENPFTALTSGTAKSARSITMHGSSSTSRTSLPSSVASTFADGHTRSPNVSAAPPSARCWWSRASKRSNANSELQASGMCPLPLGLSHASGALATVSPSAARSSSFASKRSASKRSNSSSDLKASPAASRAADLASGTSRKQWPSSSGLLLLCTTSMRFFKLTRSLRQPSNS
mmetsp:Transcript_35978/g.99137  ORF Transcript_35978/g.99137 Transcript_35978/m.99137 type:complete len:231 (+) Transcript_35978:582-1274(+)